MENRKEYQKKHGVFLMSIGERIFMYIFFYLILFGLVAFAFATGSKLPYDTGNESLNVTLLFIAIAIPLIILELAVRNNRKRNGLSLYKNVTDEFMQKEINEKIKKEKLAEENFNKSNERPFVLRRDGDRFQRIYQNPVIKKDINYYFDLKEKGAITQEEYEVKKKELLRA